MKLNQDSITVNMVVKMTTDKYLLMPDMPEGSEETSIENIRLMIERDDFTADFIPATFTNNSRATLIITEKTHGTSS